MIGLCILFILAAATVFRVIYTAVFTVNGAYLIRCLEAPTLVASPVSLLPEFVHFI